MRTAPNRGDIDVATKTKHTIDVYGCRKERAAPGIYGAVETLWHEFGSREERDAFVAERRQAPRVEVEEV
jgi:hypothetical protein